jgi:hypothetical protein
MFQHPEKIDWVGLSINPEAVSYIEEQLNKDEKKGVKKIDWKSLSSNQNPNVITLFEKYPEKIIWTTVSANPAVLPYIEKHLDKVNWSMLARNTNPSSMEIIKKKLR